MTSTRSPPMTFYCCLLKPESRCLSCKTPTTSSLCTLSSLTPSPVEDSSSKESIHLRYQCESVENIALHPALCWKVFFIHPHILQLTQGIPFFDIKKKIGKENWTWSSNCFPCTPHLSYDCWYFSTHSTPLSAPSVSLRSPDNPGYANCSDLLHTLGLYRRCWWSKWLCFRWWSGSGQWRKCRHWYLQRFWHWLWQWWVCYQKFWEGLLWFCWRRISWWFPCWTSYRNEEVFRVFNDVFLDMRQG